MKFFITAGLGLILAASSVRAELLLQDNDRVAICGDSITQQARYSVLIEDYLLMCKPVNGARVAQFGWRAKCIFDFRPYLESDIFPYDPTVLLTCYGMNVGGYSATDTVVQGRIADEVVKGIDAVKAHGVRQMVIASPGAIDFYRPHGSDPPAPFNVLLASMTETFRDVAKKQKIPFADLHSPLMDVITKAKAAFGQNYDVTGPDGMHPEMNGHLVMAYAFLKALGCDGAIGTLTVDLDKQHADGTPGQKIVSFQNGTLTIESTRYPFCFKGDPTKPGQETGSILHFLPFNAELNRYLLVVTGLKTPKAKVTWGTQSKDFAAADLAKGINLADEFLQNPFADTFFKVDAAVQAQQSGETVLLQTILHNLPGYKALLPAHAGAIDQLRTKALEQDKANFDAAAALVVPVQHTIKIEPVSS